MSTKKRLIASVMLVVMAVMASETRAQQSPSVATVANTAPVPAHLPEELSADEVLNGAYPFPGTPKIEVAEDTRGFAPQRLGKVPPPGVHPRILISPDQLPDLRKRLKETEAGRAMMATLRERTGGSLLKPGAWENEVYEKFAAGDVPGALAILKEKRKPTFAEGHYQPNIPYGLTMEAFDALVSEDAARGRKIAAAIAGWAKAVEPAVDSMMTQPLWDDVWRAKLAGPATGSWTEDQGLRDLMGNHLMGYAYDFAHGYMTEAERAQVRRTISKVTKGRVWLGARLPHHFRNWNWVAVGLSQPLLALAIEGEEGYDERVYKLGVQIARDYLTYAISKSGSSTEAVGYTQFGFVWGAPFFVAASRRGENLLTHGHHRAMLDWYLHAMEPSGAVWQSHGDGGDTGPAVWTMSMWRYFFPGDPRVATLWRNVVQSTKGKPFAGRYHIIEPLLYATDGDPAETLDASAKGDDASALKLPTTWIDPERGTVNARSGWDDDAALLRFECRPDSHGSSHEHADRGNFTFSAMGRMWAKENFRSIETRHHNSVLIDGKGQGFWPGPGDFIGVRDEGWAISAACDAKEAYGWLWPKQILAEDLSTFERFKHPRWMTYKAEAAQFQKDWAGVPMEKDPRPAVVAFWKGFEGFGARQWDEDAWPVRLPFNPVKKAYRTVSFVREGNPYLIVTDDIQKDDTERLYEWTMLPGNNTTLVRIDGNDLILADATTPVDENGVPRPKKGDRLLLVRVLKMNDPALTRDYATRPSFRLESFERKDTTTKTGRSFGLDKRLVIASRSVAPEFRILLYPHRQGDPLPQTRWEKAGDAGKAGKAGEMGKAGEVLVLKAGETEDRIEFAPADDGRSRVTLRRGDRKPVLPVEKTPSEKTPSGKSAGQSTRAE